MEADQTPDPTGLDDDQLDDLLDALAERAEQRDDLDLPGTGASRRGVLAGLLGLGGAAAGAGVASAIGENESYGNSSGVVGTDSEPLQEANIQNLHAQRYQLDHVGASATLSFNQTIPSGTQTKVEYDGVRFDDAGEFDTSTNTFSPNSGGKYCVTATHQLRFPSVGTNFIISIVVNGSRQRESLNVASKNATIDHSVSGTVELSAGDTVVVKVQHDEGSNLSLNSFTPSTYAEFIRVG